MHAVGTRIQYANLLQALYVRVFFPGEEFVYHKVDNKALGLPQEDLDGATRTAVDWALSGKAAAWS